MPSDVNAVTLIHQCSGNSSKLLLLFQDNYMKFSCFSKLISKPLTRQDHLR